MEDEHYEKTFSSGVISPPPPHPVKFGDAALEILGDGAPPREVTEEENAAILRKIDKWILPVIL
jgi:hypothetical protein